MPPYIAEVVGEKPPLVRTKVDLKSAEVGRLPIGTRVRVLKETLMPDGLRRAQIAMSGEPQPYGWMTSTTKDGTANLSGPALASARGDEPTPGDVQPPSAEDGTHPRRGTPPPTRPPRGGGGGGAAAGIARPGSTPPSKSIQRRRKGAIGAAAPGPAIQIGVGDGGRNPRRHRRRRRQR